MPFEGASARLNEYLQWVAARVDEGLAGYLPRVQPEARVLREAMEYSVIGAGKRLRAALVIESAYVCGADRERAMPVACAIEMIHAYSLIHDDLPCMDDDDYRRGKLANHKVFGEGIAVLAGDALLTQAFWLLSTLPVVASVSWDNTVRIIQEVAQAAGAEGMVGGQVADLDAEARPPDARLLEYIHTHKTGALIRASTRAGALRAGADGETLERITEFAGHFGVAFLIVDDLLDVEGDPEKLGKKTGSDARQGKLTYPRLYGIERSRSMAEKHIASAQSALAPFGERARILRELAQFVAVRRA